MRIEEHYNLVDRNTLGLNAVARYFCIVRDHDGLTEALSFAWHHKLKVLVLGGGSNVVLTGRVDALVLVPDFRLVESQGGIFRIGAGENWHEIVRRTLAEDYFGLENLSLIPGLVGAAPIQNIGAYGQELDAVFERLEAVDLVSGERLTLERDDCQFSYRDSIFKRALKDRLVITHVTLRLSSVFTPLLNYSELRAALEAQGTEGLTGLQVSDTVISIRRRKLPDPSIVGNVGSFFKNPVISSERFDQLRPGSPDLPAQPGDEGFKVSAAWLIDRVGMKGMRVGDSMVSTQHALVIINTGRATAEDVLSLCERIQDAVRGEFGIDLEIEPRVY